MTDSGNATLVGAAATAEWGARLLGPLLQRAQAGSGALVTLDGPLGAGKSTLVRALLRAAGVGGAIPSPTYTLIEPYALPGSRYLHLDLYRLADADELALLGLDELRGPGSVTLVEWAGRCPGALGQPDLAVDLAHGRSGGGAARTVHWQWRCQRP